MKMIVKNNNQEIVDEIYLDNSAVYYAISSFKLDPNLFEAFKNSFLPFEDGRKLSQDEALAFEGFLVSIDIIKSDPLIIFFPQRIKTLNEIKKFFEGIIEWYNSDENLIFKLNL